MIPAVVLALATVAPDLTQTPPESGSAVPTPSEPAAAPASSPTTSSNLREEIPNSAYAYTAYGVSAKTLGAQAYCLGITASRQKAIVGGGLTLWGSPIERLTIIGDAQRDLFGNFAPSLAVVTRILGKRDDGWSLGALGKFKVEGFGGATPAGVGTPAKNPGEVEGELEAGLLLSYASGGAHLDLNAIVGMGTGDDGEVDSEGRLRFGYDLTKLVRVGFDSQARARLNGPTYLPNGRTWDFAAGPQAILGGNGFFSAVTAGPTTMGLLSDRLGWNAIATVGGTTF